MALEYNLTVKDNGSVAIKKVGENVNILQQNFVKLDSRINTTNNYFATLNKNVNVIQAGMGKLDASIAGLGAMAMANAAAAIKDFAKEMIQSYDSAAKLSDNIGVASESIIGLRHAAELSSVGAEQMDKNMAKLSQTISKAGSGNKAAADTFAKMGIAVKNSDGTLKNSEQVLMEMADAFEKLPAGTERASLAMDVFGKSGASMVTMLKDGSGSLREMVSEGANAAGNIEGISESMQRLNDAMTRGKAAVMAMLASLADTAPIKAAIGAIENLSKSWIKFAGDRKEMANQEKIIEGQLQQGYKADLKILQAKKESINLSTKSTGEKQKEIAEIAKQISSVQKKLNLDNEELWLIEAKGRAIALNNKAKKEELSGTESETLASLQTQIKSIEGKNAAAEEAARIAAENAEKEKQAMAAATASYGENQKKMEEASKAAAKAAEEARRLNEQRIKDEAREFDELMSKKQKAIESLAAHDEKMRIASLEGEEQKIAQAMASYEKQKAELEAMHELEAMYAENEIEIRINQDVRLLELERQRNIQIDSIKQEFADKELERREEEEEENRRYYEERLQQEEALRDAKIASGEASMQAIQQMTSGYKSYSALFKASQVGEATINSVQAVLKTMSSTPFPFNIPLAALQAAAGAVQVRKIASTKMFAGGMIPGGDRYLRVNEEGMEAMLTTKGVRNAGGPAGIDALNNGSQSIRNSYDNRKSSVNVNLYPVMVTPKTLRENIEPVFKWNEQRW